MLVLLSPYCRALWGILLDTFLMRYSKKSIKRNVEDGNPANVLCASEFSYPCDAYTLYCSSFFGTSIYLFQQIIALGNFPSLLCTIQKHDKCFYLYKLQSGSNTGQQLTNYPLFSSRSRWKMCLVFVFFVFLQTGHQSPWGLVFILKNELNHQYSNSNFISGFINAPREDECTRKFMAHARLFPSESMPPRHIANAE